MSTIRNKSTFSVRMAAYIAAGVMGLKTAKTLATSRLSARNLKATEFSMQHSPNNKISTPLTAKVMRLGHVGGTLLLSTMLCLGGGLPAEAAPSPGDPATSPTPAAS